MKLDLPIALIKANHKTKIIEEPKEEILLTEIINNTGGASYLSYYLGLSAVLTLVVVLYICLCQYFSYIKKSYTY